MYMTMFLKDVFQRKFVNESTKMQDDSLKCIGVSWNGRHLEGRAMKYGPMNSTETENCICLSQGTKAHKIFIKG